MQITVEFVVKIEQPTWPHLLVSIKSYMRLTNGEIACRCMQDGVYIYILLLPRCPKTKGRIIRAPVVVVRI